MIGTIPNSIKIKFKPSPPAGYVTNIQIRIDEKANTKTSHLEIDGVIMDATMASGGVETGVFITYNDIPSNVSECTFIFTPVRVNILDYYIWYNKGTAVINANSCVSDIAVCQVPTFGTMRAYNVIKEKITSGPQKAMLNATNSISILGETGFLGVEISESLSPGIKYLEFDITDGVNTVLDPVSWPGSLEVVNLRNLSKSIDLSKFTYLTLNSLLYTMNNTLNVLPNYCTIYALGTEAGALVDTTTQHFNMYTGRGWKFEKSLYASYIKFTLETTVDFYVTLTAANLVDASVSLLNSSNRPIVHTFSNGKYSISANANEKVIYVVPKSDINITSIVYKDTTVSDIEIVGIPKLQSIKIDAVGTQIINSSIKSFMLSGDTSIASFYFMFGNCPKLTKVSKINTSKATDTGYMFANTGIITAPEMDLRNVLNSAHMFDGCAALTMMPSTIDVSNSLNTSYMFANCGSLITISSINVPKSTDTSYMFFLCKALVTLSITTLETLNAEYMFYGCNKLASALQLGTAKAKNTRYMFNQCEAIENVSLSVVASTDTSYMFSYCGSLVTISTLNCVNSLNTEYMFYSCTKLVTVNLTSIIKAINTSYMFANATLLASISGLITPAVRNMQYMFYTCGPHLRINDYTKFVNTSLLIDSTDSITNMSYQMFWNCDIIKPSWPTGKWSSNGTFIRSTIVDDNLFRYSKNEEMAIFDRSPIPPPSNITSKDISIFHDGAVLLWYVESTQTQYWYSASTEVYCYNTDNFFYNCRNLKTLDSTKFFNTSAVTSMYGMFEHCADLNLLNLSNFNTSAVTHMGNMFSSCWNLESLDISNFDTRNVQFMGGMFASSGIVSLDLSNFHTNRLENAINMFYNADMMEFLDISNFDTTISYIEKDFSGMFNHTLSLTHIVYGDKFIYTADTTILTNNMFFDCDANLPNWNGTWDEEGTFHPA